MDITQIILVGLLGGCFINLCDVTITVLFAAKSWTKVIESQGIKPNPLTPLYYVSASFVAGIILAVVLSVGGYKYGMNSQTALVASVLVWGISRLYGFGHVVMRQMPLKIFTTMSSGLLLGFVVAGQVILWYFTK
jgi:hypothetical protein